MKSTVRVPESLLGPLREFVEAEKIKLRIISDGDFDSDGNDGNDGNDDRGNDDRGNDGNDNGDGDADVEIVVCSEDERKKSNLETLYSGGWIACETARALARKLGIATMKMGKLLTRVDCKVKRCALGCFK